MTILKNVHVGRGAVIGAGSVVVRDVPAYAVVVGNPGRVVKMRARIPENGPIPPSHPALKTSILSSEYILLSLGLLIKPAE